MYFLQRKYEESECLLHKLIDGKELKIRCGKLDKFGRILCDVFVLDSNGTDIHVNKHMIDSKLCFPYSGLTKLTLPE